MVRRFNRYKYDITKDDYNAMDELISSLELLQDEFPRPNASGNDNLEFSARPNMTMNFMDKIAIDVPTGYEIDEYSTMRLPLDERGMFVVVKKKDTSAFRAMYKTTEKNLAGLIPIPLVGNASNISVNITNIADEVKWPMLRWLSYNPSATNNSYTKSYIKPVGERLYNGIALEYKLMLSIKDPNFDLWAGNPQGHPSGEAALNALAEFFNNNPVIKIWEPFPTFNLGGRLTESITKLGSFLQDAVKMFAKNPTTPEQVEKEKERRRYERRHWS